MQKVIRRIAAIALVTIVLAAIVVAGRVEARSGSPLIHGSPAVMPYPTPDP